MMKIYRVLLILVSLFVVMSSSGCAHTQCEKDETCCEASDHCVINGETTSLLTDEEKEPSYKVSGYCVINGKTMSFLADEEKERLRAPLIKLLSNETHEIYADTARGEIIGYEAYDPDQPTVLAGYACGLYDITGDGMPELLIHPNGYYGSSGTVTYFVYDVFSGAYITSIDGGINESWCVYYFTETDELCSVGSYWRRGGWEARYYVRSFLKYDAIKSTYDEDLYLYAAFSIQGDNSSGEAGEYRMYFGELEGNCSGAEYFIRGEAAHFDDYYKEVTWFNTRCIRIYETELQMIRWSVCSSEDRFIRAEQMVDALLSTSQEFIVGMN